MAEKMIVVGCRLPHGIILEHPTLPGKTVEIRGKNKAVIIGADFSSTEVDGEFWEAWKAANKDFPALKSGAIFEAKNRAEAAAVARELKDEITGFEPMPQTDKGVNPATESEQG